MGVNRQLAECRALADRHNLSVVGEFVDDDRSAYTGKRRPEFDRLRDLVQTGAVDVVVAWHPDRLTRHPRELEDLIDLLEATSTTVRTVESGEFDLGSASGRMTARVVGAVARAESEHKSARLRSKHRQLAEAGAVAGGGHRPFGFEIDRVTIRESEAEVIREVRRRLLAGASLHGICRDLAAREITTTTGRPWRPHTLARMMRAARIAGLREHRGRIVGPAVWDAIVSPDDLVRLRAVLDDPSRRRTEPGRPRKLLTGIVVCGGCGCRMVSRPRADRVDTYICVGPPSGNGCGSRRIVAGPLDELVVAAVLTRLASPEIDRAMVAPADDRPALDELDRIEQRRTELATLWAAGEIDRVEWRAAADALDERRRTVESTIAESAADPRTLLPITPGGGAADRFLALTHDERRDLLTAVIETISIGPAVRGRNRFDGDRVDVTWRL